jgi:hypothetical protein
MSGGIKRPLVVVSAIAATAAGIVVPFALRSGGGDVPVVQPDARTAGAFASPAELSEMVLADRQQADVDGDGRIDEVRLLRAPTQRDDDPANGSVEVVLADGATLSASVPVGYFSKLQPPVDINGDGRDQVLLDFTAGGDSAPLLIYGLHDGRLVQLRADVDVPLGLGMDGPITGSDYYVDATRLYSWLRTDPFEAGRTVYKVETWKWSVEGDRLMATPLGEGCVDITTEDPPQPCG